MAHEYPRAREREASSRIHSAYAAAVYLEEREGYIASREYGVARARDTHREMAAVSLALHSWLSLALSLRGSEKERGEKGKRIYVCPTYSL